MKYVTTNYQFVDPKTWPEVIKAWYHTSKIITKPVHKAYRVTSIHRWNISPEAMCIWYVILQTSMDIHLKLLFIAYFLYLELCFWQSFMKCNMDVIFQQIDKQGTQKGFKIAVNCWRIISLKFFSTTTIPWTPSEVCYPESIQLYGVSLSFIIGLVLLLFTHNKKI